MKSTGRRADWKQPASCALAVLLVAATTARGQEGTLEWEEMTSIALDQTRTFGIYLPPSYHTSDKAYPSFYVLHGKQQDASSRASIRSTLDRMIQSGEIGEMIAVLVDGDNSCYLNEYETHIVGELVEHVDARYRTIPERESRGITGYSMGAFGSMHLAFRYPEEFSVAVAQAIAGFSAAGNAVPPELERWLVMSEWYPPDVDTYLAQSQRLTGVKIAHGVADPGPLASIEAAREYHQLLLDNGIDHTYVERPGRGHVFVDEESLPFLSDHLHPVRQISWLRRSVVHATEALGQPSVDQPTPLEVEIVLDPRADLDGAAPRLTLDLSPVGGPAELPLASSDGVRHLASITITPPRSGRYDLGVSMWPGFAWDLENARYPLLTTVLDVWPTDDAAVYVDACAPGWEATSRGLESLTVVQTDNVHVGAAACAAHAKSSFAGWHLSFEAADAVHPFGFGVLRLAIHPGDLAPAESDRLTISLGGTGGAAVDLLNGAWVDWARPEWQQVEIPMGEFQAENAITGIQFSGTPAGTLYLDDVRLVADRPPAPTAVAESRTAANPRHVALSQNYPNPFNSSTVIGFTLPATGQVELVVFNTAGQQVATLVDGVREAGTHTVRWDGRDGDGRELASGVYLLNLRMGDRQQVEMRKLVLIR